MINRADIIAVGHVEWSRDSVIFTPDEVLKGAIKTGHEYPIRSPFPAESFSEKQLISVTHGEKFMLVARWSKEAEIHPIYGLCSAWPQGTTAELLPQRTLVECISFARQTLGVSPGKNVSATTQALTPSTPQTSASIALHPPDSSGSPLESTVRPAISSGQQSRGDESRRYAVWAGGGFIIVAALLIYFWKKSR
jgi:hypothetical protein